MAFLETIDHGPFPFAQLKIQPAAEHGGDTELENPSAVKGLFETTKGKSLFTADSRISYSGDMSTIDFIPRDTRRINLR